MAERLQKLLSAAGVASRRAAEALITGGRVMVNGVTVTTLGTRAEPTDDVRVDGRRIRAGAAAPRRYLLLNKPRGYITSRSDPKGRPTVIDLLARHGVRDYVYPVGRLDYDSQGLLILTSDGELAEKLTHPSHEVGREYEVRVRGLPDERALQRLSRGITLDGRRTAPAEVRVTRELDARGPGAETVLLLVIHEGRNRQVRRMCEAVGHPVLHLRRVAFGPIRDDRLKPGAFRDLTPDEVRLLKGESPLRRPRRRPPKSAP